jgi:polyvinyl alcohol dehydrogenase (cytochrome)
MPRVSKSFLTAVFLFVTGGALTTEARADWPTYNHDGEGSRHAADEDHLGPLNAAQLAPKWTFETPGAVTGTPAVVGGRVFAGDYTGTFYSLRAKDGKLRWKTQVNGAISASALVTGNRVIFGDLSGHVYSLDKKTGAIQWQTRPNPHPFSAVYGSATKVGRYVAIGFSSMEWFAPAIIPDYPCCSFRGSVALIDPKNGNVVWQTYFVSDQESANGVAGVPVWSTPTYDPGLGLIFVTTGNNYTFPANNLSDSVVALDPETGAIVWANQRYADDTWNILYPPFPPTPDYDIGDSAQIYTLPDGTKVVGAGQKSGFFHVLEAATGQEIATRQFQVAAAGLGGMFADSAYAGGVVYANSANFPSYGEVIAFTGDTSQELWRFQVGNGGNTLSGVAVANGVVYFSAMDGNLYAVRASDGAGLAQVAIGAHTSGPSVSGGRVFVGTGDSFGLFYGYTATGSIVSLGAGCDHDDAEAP